jgi:hypothetical protein
MIEKNGVSIQDNFLVEKEFATLRDVVIDPTFPWYFQKTKTGPKEDLSISPGQFTHMIYAAGAPYSHYDSYLVPILEQLNFAISTKIKLNLNPRLTEPFYSDFHIDNQGFLPEDIIARSTTSIFYINTNNGYTEFEQDGTIVESVANRLVSFPSNTNHRGVTQTDEQTRVVLNFNYLK